MKLRKSTLAIGILVVVAFALTAAIGLKYMSLLKARDTKSFTLVPSTPTPNPVFAELLNTPPQNASDDVKKKHFQKVIKYAKDADHLEITDCFGKPVVLFVTVDRPVIIKNNDAVVHEISLNKNAHYSIPAKSTDSYMMTFAEGPGVYGFGCDNSGKTSGLLVVRP